MPWIKVAHLVCGRCAISMEKYAVYEKRKVIFLAERCQKCRKQFHYDSGKKIWYGTVPGLNRNKEQ